MSEFECKYGHLMRAGECCKECAAAGRPFEHSYYMDGMTSRQHAQKERAEEREERLEELEEG